MDNPNTGGDDTSNGSPLSGKIMLCSVVVLFTVIVVMLCLHIYIRWHMPRRQHERRRSRSRQRLHFSPDQAPPASRRGLDRRVLDSIPIFVYSSEKAEVVEMECAVCLCEFQEKEKGRVLPGCKHSFHAECIDMWFFSHSTCPLCRSAVVMEELQSKEAGVGHLCESCWRDGELVDSSSSSSTSSSSQNGSSGGSEIRIEVSARRVEEEFKSPGGRMLSFKRILARESWFNRGCSGSGSGSGGGGGGGGEDVERGEVEEEER